MNRTLVFGLALLALTAGGPGADAQSNSAAAVSSNAASTLSPVDYNFVAQANASLFRYEIQNGTDPDLKAFAQHTLPKIEDHLQRALKLAKSSHTF